MDQFVPRVKRQIDVQQWLPVIKPGMMGAVEYGTARRANYNADEPIFGKTGTCTDGRSPTHLGWFGSYNEIGNNKLVVVVLLTGGHASEWSGGIRRCGSSLSEPVGRELLHQDARNFASSISLNAVLLPLGCAV